MMLLRLVVPAAKDNETTRPSMIRLDDSSLSATSAGADVHLKVQPAGPGR